MTEWRRIGWLAVAVSPILILIGAGSLLLLGLLASVAIATIALRRSGSSWRLRGFHRPGRVGRLLLVVGIATTAMLLLTGPLQVAVSALTGSGPDLAPFEVLRGNVAALLGGLVVVWSVAAFGEELLFRGYLLNEIAEILPGRLGRRARWAIAFALTSVVVGLGHAYQGHTGMVMTGVLAVGFGLVYLAADRNLWASILTHGLYDTVGFILVFAGVAELG